MWLEMYKQLCKNGSHLLMNKLQKAERKTNSGNLQ